MTNQLKRMLGNVGRKLVAGVVGLATLGGCATKGDVNALWKASDDNGKLAEAVYEAGKTREQLLRLEIDRLEQQIEMLEARQKATFDATGTLSRALIGNMQNTAYLMEESRDRNLAKQEALRALEAIDENKPEVVVPYREGYDPKSFSHQDPFGGFGR